MLIKEFQRSGASQLMMLLILQVKVNFSQHVKYPEAISHPNLLLKVNFHAVKSGAT